MKSCERGSSDMIFVTAFAFTGGQADPEIPTRTAEFDGQRRERVFDS